MYLKIVWWLITTGVACALLSSWQFPSSYTDCKRHAQNEKKTREDNQTTRQYKERKTGKCSGALALLCHTIS